MPTREGTTKNMTHTAETGHVTGTADKDYDLVWFTERCLNNVLRLETFVADAERGGDNELAVLIVAAARSEEHTSELQSHLNLVCRLLLEKKKNTEVHYK